MYERLYLSKEQIKNSIHLQVLAHMNPKRLRLTKGVPKTQIDKIIFNILNKKEEEDE